MPNPYDMDRPEEDGEIHKKNEEIELLIPNKGKQPHIDEPRESQMRRTERVQQFSARYLTTKYSMITNACEQKKFQEVQVHEYKYK